MCDTCGCEGGAQAPAVPFVELPEDVLPARILSMNEAIARRIRERFRRAGVLALNILGAPGAGKTALLQATLDRLAPRGVRAGVVVADLATDNDARRLARPGVPVIALETGTTCHLTADLLERALRRLPLEDLDLLFIENVGNLVCPALFDLGEAAKVVLVSAAEGSDKPEKYPVMFQGAALLAITKTDLLPYVDFDVAAAAGHARRLNPEIEVVSLSARTGEGMEPWLRWISERLRRSRAS